VRQVVGLDLTRSLLDIGARRLADAGLTNVLLQLGSALDLPFVDDSFDVVFCRSALHHLTDPVAAVAEMGRVCRRGGRVVVSDMVPPDASVREAFDVVHRQVDPSHVAVLVEGELAALAATLGVVSGGERSDPFRLPIAQLFTDLSQADAALSTLRAELAGGAATGFEPQDDGTALTVAFRSAVVQVTVA
jgi:SAM-dependent methyltransferase